MYEENIKKKKVDEVAEQSNPALYSQDLNKAKETVDPITPSSSVGTSNNGSNNYDLYQQDLTVEQDPNSVYMDEIQKALHDKNYKALLQSDIAAYNLKMNTQKYLDQNLAAQGLNSQGYGTSAHVGVENQAQNLYAQNLENYNRNEADYLAEAQERKTNKEAQDELELQENEKQLITYLQGTDGSDEQIAEQMSNYGYVRAEDGRWYRKDANGNPDMGSPASDYVNGMITYMKNTGDSGAAYGSQASNKEIANAQSFLNAYGVGRDADGNVLSYGSVSDLRRASVSAEDDSKTKAMKDVVANELDYLEKQIQGGYVKDGTLFKLQRGSGSKEAYLVLYLGGKFYIVSSSDDETEGSEVANKYNQYTGPKTEIADKKK